MGVLEVGVLEVEFWNSSRQEGSFWLKKSTKCCKTAVFPSVPGTRTRRIGERRAPVLMSKSEPGEGRALRDASERAVYAMLSRRRAGRRNTALESFMVVVGEYVVA